jgi:TolB-like protein
MHALRSSFGVGMALLGTWAASGARSDQLDCNRGCRAPGVAFTQQQDRPGVAVFPLEYGGSLASNSDGLERLSIGIQQLLLNHFLQNPSIRVVERLRIKEILDEQGLNQAGRVDAQTAARIGKLVGARYLVLGGYSELPDMQVSARIVDTETSEILYSRRVSGQRDKLMGLVTDLAGQIENGIKGLPPLPAGVREARRSQESLPAEVGFLYSQALAAADDGLKDVAIDLYQQITQRFPQFTPAREALRQLRGT